MLPVELQSSNSNHLLNLPIISSEILGQIHPTLPRSALPSLEARFESTRRCLPQASPSQISSCRHRKRTQHGSRTRCAIPVPSERTTQHTCSAAMMCCSVGDDTFIRWINSMSSNKTSPSPRMNTWLLCQEAHINDCHCLWKHQCTQSPRFGPHFVVITCVVFSNGENAVSHVDCDVASQCSGTS